MTNVVVIYKSKYGATKKYAQWLSEELEGDIIEKSKVKIENILKYDTVIYGGGIYATGIAGISFLKKHYKKIEDKKVIVFAVDASPYDEKASEFLKERNLKDELSKIPCFYCRGAWNEEIMTFKDRALCNLLKKAVAKKDPSTFEPWEKSLMEAIGSIGDWTNKDNLNGLLACIRKK